jgi:hypothetical protein
MIFNCVFIVFLSKKSRNKKHTCVCVLLGPVGTNWDLLEPAGTC